MFFKDKMLKFQVLVNIYVIIELSWLILRIFNFIIIIIKVTYAVFDFVCFRYMEKRLQCKYFVVYAIETFLKH